MDKDGLIFMFSKENRRVSFNLKPEVFDKMMEEVKKYSEDKGCSRSAAFNELLGKYMGM